MGFFLGDISIKNRVEITLFLSQNVNDNVVFSIFLLFILIRIFSVIFQ